VETVPPVAVGAAEEKKDEFPVSEQEIADYYNKHKSGFVEDADPAGSMRAAHILVYKHEIAAEILAQLRKAPDAFAKLAEKHSKCNSSSSGGDLGVFDRGAMVKEFEQAVLALKPGEISGVVKTQFGYHIIRRDPIRTGKQLTLQEVSSRIRTIIREEKKDAKMRERIGNVLNSGSASLEK
jgi:parvulin-like peptidyl-prolyl isomerase